MYITCEKCKYNYDGECDFYAMGSGNEIDMPCYRERELIRETGSNRLKIGHEVLIHGYVDEIRNDTIIIRNEGGYFGTVEHEITDLKMPNTDDVLDKIRAEIEEYRSRQLALAIGVADLEKGKQIALEYVIAIIDKYTTESGDKE